jgi:BirA family biotin operon repressor/biotin-[acetyl-CoA-carboxylase] ligase
MIPMPPHDVCHTGRQRLGRQLWSFQRVQSTNTLALALGNDPANDGLVLLAHEQSSGRGQNGRTWTAPAGSSVLLSALLFPPVSLRRPALLTAWAAVSVCETIDEVVGLQASIKWPNDVLVQGRKVCGILIEQRHAGPRELPPATVVGVGLNVQQSARFFDEANLPLAASLASLSGKTLETRLVAERLIDQLDMAYDRLLQGDTATLEALWKTRLGLLGEQVVLETLNQKEEGRLLDITWEGLLLAQSGTAVQILPEMVRHMDLLKTSQSADEVSKTARRKC